MMHAPTQDSIVLCDALSLLLHPKSELSWKQAAEGSLQQEVVTRCSSQELEAGLDRLKYIWAGLCKRLNSHRPIHRLPTEILEKIFGMCILSDTTKRITRALVLSQVCELWSRIIHARSSFWSTISPADHPDLAIKLSKESPLLFYRPYLSVYDDDSWKLFQKIAHRVKAALLQLSHESDQLALVVSHLEVLVLCRPKLRSTSRIELGLMPSLRKLTIVREHVNLDGFRAPRLRLFHVLQKLRLSESGCISILQNILRESPLLEWIIVETEPGSGDSNVEAIHGKSGGLSNNDTISLACLKQLCLPNFKRIGVLCAFIDAPSLEMLDVNLTLADNLTPEGDLIEEIFSKQRIPLPVAAARNTRSPLYVRAFDSHKLVLSNNRPIDSKWAVHMSVEFSAEDMRLAALQRLIDATQFYDVPLVVNFSPKTHLVERLHGVAAVRVNSAKRLTSLVDLLLSLDGVDLYHSLTSVQLGWLGVEEEQLQCETQRLYACSPPKRLPSLEPFELASAEPEPVPISERLSLWDRTGKQFNVDTSKFEEVAPTQRGKYTLLYAEGSGDDDYLEDRTDKDEDEDYDEREDDEDKADKENDENEGGDDGDEEEDEEDEEEDGEGSEE